MNDSPTLSFIWQGGLFFSRRLFEVGGLVRAAGCGESTTKTVRGKRGHLHLAQVQVSASISARPRPTDGARGGSPLRSEGLVYVRRQIL